MVNKVALRAWMDSLFCGKATTVATVHRTVAKSRLSSPTADIKNNRYPNGYLLFLAPLVGLEPTTCGLTVIGRNSPLIFLRPLSQISPVIMDLFKVMD